MPLSEQEKRTLELLEAQLAAEDPRFASAMVADPRRAVRRRRLLIGATTAVVGAVLLVVAVWQHQTPVGVLGFVLVALGVAYGLGDLPSVGAGAGSTLPRADHQRPLVTRTPVQSGSRTPAQRSFMSTLEARWERRRYENQGW